MEPWLIERIRRQEEQESEGQGLPLQLPLPSTQMNDEDARWGDEAGEDPSERGYCILEF